MYHYCVAHREPAASGGLQVRAAVRRLDDLHRRSPFLYRRVRWRQWFSQSFYHNLEAAVDELSRHGVTLASVENTLGAAQPRPHTRAQARRMERCVQRTARQALSQVLRVHPEQRLRQKLARWRLSVFPRVRAMRAARVVPRLRKLVPPRVMAAVLRTWFNGWCTQRRFQGRGRCIFGCNFGEDSVDHYFVCTRLHRQGLQQLRLPIAPVVADRGAHFLLLAAPSQLADDKLVRRALLLAAAYRLHCAHRRQAPFRDEEVLRRALAQALREAALGHAGAMRSLAMVWAPTA